MERIKRALERAREDRAREEQVRDGARPRATVAEPGGDTALDAADIGRASSEESSPADQAPSAARTRTRKTSPRAAVLRRNRVLTEDSDPDVVAAYMMLRTKVLQRMKARDWNALAVTSPSAGEGKTLTAVNLAISIAREVNHTVLLVDLDLRRPGVHRVLDHVPERGISDYLVEGTPLPEILFTPSIDRMVVLPGRGALANSSEMLSSPSMVALVDELKSRYPERLVVFDLPPVLSADDAMAFAPYVDAVLLVMCDGVTSRRETQVALDNLGSTPVIGTVLNRSREAPETPPYL